MFCLDSADVTFFCRDLYESKQYCSQAFFCHDMAFYLFDKITSENLSTGQTGYFFRTDRESLGKQNYIALNMDISLWGNEITPTGNAREGKVRLFGRNGYFELRIRQEG